MMQHPKRHLWIPSDIPPERWNSRFAHVSSCEWAIDHCKQRRTVVQAGGNIGLWPMRLAKSFARVLTFEPEPVSLECLRANVPANVEVYAAALGDHEGTCGIYRKGVGTHRVKDDGDGVPLMTLDSLHLTDVDYLQLDIEGYEWFALRGARDTIQMSLPLIQVELRGHGRLFGHDDPDVRALLNSFGYGQLKQQPGCDYVFAWGKR